MVLGGIWHGAGWTFLLWGTLHGIALTLYHLARPRLPKMPRFMGWALTMAIVVAGWVLFRAESIADAFVIYQKMSGVADRFLQLDSPLLNASPYLAIGAFVAFLCPNSIALASRFRPSLKWSIVAGLCLALGILFMLGQISAPEFLYYDF